MKAIALTMLGLATPLAAAGGALAATPAAPATPAAIVQAKFTDGTYTGQSAYAYWGNVQVQVKVQGGQIAGFTLLDYPRHTGTSISINRQALPILAQEVIDAQSAQVSFVSGATLSSQAFLQSVASALPH